MQLTSIIALALPILASAAPEKKAGNHQVAKIINKCASTVYVQSVPNNGAAPSKVIGLTGHGNGHYSEKYVAGGSSLRISNTNSMQSPLAFDYTPSGDEIWYDLGDQFGNPFIKYENTLIPHEKSCYKFECEPNDTECYSNLNGNTHIEQCQMTGLTLTLCA